MRDVTKKQLHKIIKYIENYFWSLHCAVVLCWNTSSVYLLTYLLTCKVSRERLSISTFILLLWTRTEVEDDEDDEDLVPELGVGVQLQHWRVCVPLKRPGFASRGSKRGHAGFSKQTLEQSQQPTCTHEHTDRHTHTQSLSQHLSRAQLNTETPIQFNAVTVIR